MCTQRQLKENEIETEGSIVFYTLLDKVLAGRVGEIKTPSSQNL